MPVIEGMGPSWLQAGKTLVTPMQSKSLNIGYLEALKQLLIELKSEEDEGETSALNELLPPDPLRGGPVYQAVQQVEQYCPGGRLPDEIRSAWQGMLRRADNGEGESDLIVLRERFNELWRDLHKWAVTEISRLEGEVRNSPDTFRPAELAKRLGCTTETVNRYAKSAGVSTPEKGKREHRYSAADAMLICKAILESSATSELKKQANMLLWELNNPPKSASKSE